MLIEGTAKRYHLAGLEDGVNIVKYLQGNHEEKSSACFTSVEGHNEVG